MSVFNNPYMQQLGILPMQQQQKPLQGIFSPQGLTTLGASLLAGSGQGQGDTAVIGNAILGTKSYIDQYNDKLNEGALKNASYNLNLANAASDYDYKQKQLGIQGAELGLKQKEYGLKEAQAKAVSDYYKNQVPIVAASDPMEAMNIASQRVQQAGMLGDPQIFQAAKAEYDMAKDRYERDAGVGASMDERQSAIFYNNMQSAEKNLQKYEATGKPTGLTDVAGSIPLLGAYVERKVSDTDQQQYKQAAMEWIRAKLRKESGAAIGKDEMEQDYNTFFPRVGDTPEQVAQKAAARQTISENLKIGAGRLANKLSPITQTNTGILGGAIPQVGQVYKGHKFLGGNPSDPKNWSKI